ncbi:putative E3 ubiquitin ligase complex SCF subunit sconB [Eufriesea mexicana]|nr:putative E3 ubiquitin ligase complex SCF subunit sconB [Eufriesea mexicana]
MEIFKCFLRAIGLMEPAKVDFLSELPPEVSQLILRKLDPESLLCAAQVSRKWMEICKSDKILRRTARRHKNRKRRQIREQFLRVSVRSPRVVPVRTLRELKRRNENMPCPRVDTAIVFGTTRPTQKSGRSERNRTSYRNKVERGGLTNKIDNGNNLS